MPEIEMTLQRQLEIALGYRDACERALNEMPRNLPDSTQSNGYMNFMGWADWSVEILILQDKIASQKQELLSKNIISAHSK